MKIPQKLTRSLLMLSALLCGIAVATFDLIRLDQAMSLAGSVASAFGTVEKITVSVRLFFGLIPVGNSEYPYLVTAVGDIVLGTLVAGFAILLCVLLVTLRQTTPVSSNDTFPGA